MRYLSNLRNKLWPTAVEEHESILEALLYSTRFPVITSYSIHYTKLYEGVANELAKLGRPLNLRLAALVLDNFKSFKMKTRIPLRDGFSTISGPNGSGKSNLIDAHRRYVR